MPTIDELHAATQHHSHRLSDVEAQLAAQQQKLNGQDADIARHDGHLSRLDDAIVALREAQATNAKREDVQELTREINAHRVAEAQKETANMQRAFDSIPGKLMVWLTLAMVVVTIFPWLWQHFLR